MCECVDSVSFRVPAATIPVYIFLLVFVCLFIYKPFSPTVLSISAYSACFLSFAQCSDLAIFMNKRYGSGCQQNCISVDLFLDKCGNKLVQMDFVHV